MVNIRFLLFYCILLCAPEQQEQIQAITIKSGHTPWLSNTIMMRILMRHLSKTPHHPHSSATTCHPKWGISCLQKAHCTLFTAFFGPTFDFAVQGLVQTAADWQEQVLGLGRAPSLWAQESCVTSWQNEAGRQLHLASVGIEGFFIKSVWITMPKMKMGNRNSQPLRNAEHTFFHRYFGLW